MGEDTESALHGVQVFLDAQAVSVPDTTGLSHAAYWVALRQEIITVFSKQRPFRLSLEPCQLYRTFEPADDNVWANRLVTHCADVLRYCFGCIEESMTHDSATSPTFSQLASTPSNPDISHPFMTTTIPVSAKDMTSAQRNARYGELVAFDALWTELGPASFNPIYSRDPDRTLGQVFPELWYLNDCHVTGIEHLEIARIVLAVQNPNIPQFGVGRRTAMQALDQDIKCILLRLCGIGLSNQHSPPALITASVAIAMCGDRLTDRVEQKALLGVLVKLEEEHAWPTHATQKSLKEAWSWDDDGP